MRVGAGDHPMLAWPGSHLSVPELHQTASPFALYLHLPFCDHKCAYCDFNSYAGLDHLIPAYVDALERDIELWATIVPGRGVRTIFFGGGTPSLTPVAGISRILDAV